MIKILLLAVGVWLIFTLLKKYGRSLEKDEEAAAPSQIEEDMVRCEQCGVHLPRSEAILSGGDFFCCDEHRRLHRPE
ncbi:MAG: PP0621 family protein [Pseudomonadota bacterium]|nr:hypothetical protein [Gammaproteobacteria bacterium]MBU1731829.1 hypothetical protein [Gammaproteobacteria bacterium]MBU1892440.1 hypothetical protein [Gammaproteobacteria bacterium]